MRIRWTAPAVADLESIKKYLDRHFPHFSRSTVLRLYEGVRSLKTMPERGRMGLRAGTREFILAPMPYIIVYRVREDAVEILRLYHGAQERG
jgi:toxin ParE1/3/4